MTNIPLIEAGKNVLDCWECEGALSDAVVNQLRYALGRATPAQQPRQESVEVKPIIDPNCTCDEHGACAYCWNGKKNDTAAQTSAQQPRQESEIAAEALTWQPIETAPKDSVSRLYRIHGFCVQGFIDATGALMVQSEISPHWRMARGKPTHWMPLPAAPKREAGK